MDVKRVIELFNLKPQPFEGGYFRETYRSEEIIEAGHLPERYISDRHISTAIYYLLTPDTVSKIHKLKSDEIFHFYLGDAVTMLLLYPDGRSDTVTLGSDIENGQLVQKVVPRGVWQGAKLCEGGRFALMGTTVAPGFEPEDFELAERQELLNKFTGHEELIRILTL
jgi:predicted cupin superfamily sugar epimerase